MSTSVKRSLPMIVVAALFVAALGMASVGASSLPAGPSATGLAVAPVAPPRAGFQSIESDLVDLADPYDWRDPACAGWLLTYTLTFTNTSGMQLTGLVLSDTIPANTEYRESSDEGVFDGASSVVWQIPALQAGQVISRELVIRPFTSVPAGTVITDVVNVLRDGIVIEDAAEGTTIIRCAEPTATATNTPIVTITPTVTPSVTPEGVTKIWLPIVMKNFVH